MLDGNQVRLDERQIVISRGIKHSYHAGVVNSCGEDGKEISQK